MYVERISTEGDNFDLDVKKNMIEKSGAWYSIDGERMGQGRDAAKRFLKENAPLKNELRAKILAAYGIGQKPEAADEEGKKALASAADEKGSAKGRKAKK